eukprot:NODE_285_length_2489_cov_17.958510_g264_i0.p1 GENE.NODE_285_length_2489_cov_17.958510_g264_i0~~NODE_285_length_2489_cov_17.958510_g264_i0.p1  ORF type:complete len:813 (+),score=125.11 NODE_285_length_2489_cov_17.958510_g264_i0:57-2441(+)
MPATVPAKRPARSEMRLMDPMVATAQTVKGRVTCPALDRWQAAPSEPNARDLTQLVQRHRVREYKAPLPRHPKTARAVLSAVSAQGSVAAPHPHKRGRPPTVPSDEELTIARQTLQPSRTTRSKKQRPLPVPCEPSNEVSVVSIETVESAKHPLVSVEDVETPTRTRRPPKAVSVVSIETVESAKHPPRSVEDVETPKRPPRRSPKPVCPPKPVQDLVVSVETVESAKHPLVSVEDVEASKWPNRCSPKPVLFSLQRTIGEQELWARHRVAHSEDNCRRMIKVRMCKYRQWIQAREAALQQEVRDRSFNQSASAAALARPRALHAATGNADKQGSLPVRRSPPQPADGLPWQLRPKRSSYAKRGRSVPPPLASVVSIKTVETAQHLLVSVEDVKSPKRARRPPKPVSVVSIEAVEAAKLPLVSVEDVETPKRTRGPPETVLSVQTVDPPKRPGRSPKQSIPVNKLQPPRDFKDTNISLSINVNKLQPLNGFRDSNISLVSIQQRNERLLRRASIIRPVLVLPRTAPLPHPPPTTTEQMRAILEHNWHHLTALNNRVRASHAQMEGGVLYKHHSRFEVCQSRSRVRRNLVSLARCANLILEIGFNAGHSTLLMLLANPDCTVFIFDTCQHPYTLACAQYLQEAFGHHRVHLTVGDSTYTVPQFQASHPQLQFDLFHVDGDHTTPAAQQDLFNCRRMARSGSVVVFDDVNFQNLGELWRSLLATQVIRPLNTLLKSPFHAIGMYHQPSSPPPRPPVKHTWISAWESVRQDQLANSDRERALQVQARDHRHTTRSRL